MEVLALQLFNGLSLGSILLLVSLGLALSFGLMNVINMAHGEFIMIGAYATFLCQNLLAAGLGGLDAGLWFVAALPLAFLAAAAVGLLLEVSIIRHLYGRPLDTLLATWGVALVLQQAGIAFTVVPGITAALGCAASCGIPLTHRGLARSVTLVTGHLQQEVDDSAQLQFEGWRSLVSAGHTMVFYMGLEQADSICTGLLSVGAQPSLPVALIVAGTSARQRVVTCSLANLASQAARLKGESPVLIMVGEVVRLREQLAQVSREVWQQVA